MSIIVNTNIFSSPEMKAQVSFSDHLFFFVFFSSLNQRYDIIICVYYFELFSQVSDVAHGPLVFQVRIYGN